MQSSLTESSDIIIKRLSSIRKNLLEAILAGKNCEYTVPQIFLMRELYQHPGITLNELSGRLSLSKGTVSGIISRLVQQGAVIRTIPEENRRTIQLTLAPEILEKGDMAVNIKTSHLAGILEKSDPEKIRQLIESLEFLDSLLVQ